jgi:aminoglycoside phosphotransferase (APT) family kinase protein
VHSLHAPGARPQDSRRFLGVVWSALDGVAMPKFVGEAIAALLDEAPPPVERAAVLCHNDVNPTNIVYDGRRVLLVDWQNAARNDPLYDLATAAMFFRMDEPACRALLAAYDGTPDAELSPRFHYDRRLAAASSGAAFLRLAHSAGHTGATADATLDSAPSLAELYRGLTTGS